MYYCAKERESVCVYLHRRKTEILNSLNIREHAKNKNKIEENIFYTNELRYIVSDTHK
jgi:hypothetical protein